MKAVVLSDNDGEREKITQVIQENFPALEITSSPMKEFNVELIGPVSLLQFVVLGVGDVTGPVDELFLEISSKCHNRPIIFVNVRPTMTLPKDIYLHNMANEVLEYPFDARKLAMIMASSLIWTEEQIFHENTQELDPKGIISMKIKNFFDWNCIPFDAFMEINSPKFVKIIFANRPYSQRQLIKYVKKNVKFLYLWKKDYLEFLENNLAKHNDFFENTPFASVLQSAWPKIFKRQIEINSFVHDYIRRVGVTESLITYMDNLVNSILKVHNAELSCKTLFKIFPQESDVAARGVLTAYVCQTLLNELNWTSELIRRKMIFISLIHDCMITREEHLKFLYKIDATLAGLTSDEEKSYFEHTIKAADLAMYFNKYPETAFIIAQHHEMANGSGFPFGYNSVELIPLSCLFNLASNFVNQVYGKIDDRKTIAEVLKVFVMIYKKGEFKQPLGALVKEFQ